MQNYYKNTIISSKKGNFYRNKEICFITYFSEICSPNFIRFSRYEIKEVTFNYLFINCFYNGFCRK